MTPRIEILQAIIEAWKAKDIDAVLSHMDKEIVWHFAVAGRAASARQGPGAQVPAAVRRGRA